MLTPKMATFTPAVKSVCLETRTLVLLFILMSLISDGTCQSISLTCPLLQEGSITKFECAVPTSMCTYTSVFFDFESKDGTSSRLCLTTSSSTCGQQPAGEMTCGCVRSNSGVRYYQVSFLGNKTTHNEGRITCDVNCVPPRTPAVCQPLIFALPFTSPSTTTVESEGNGNSMHVLRTGIVASMSGIIALISTHSN